MINLTLINICLNIYWPIHCDEVTTLNEYVSLRNNRAILILIWRRDLDGICPIYEYTWSSSWI